MLVYVTSIDALPPDVDGPFDSSGPAVRCQRAGIRCR